MGMGDTLTWQGTLPLGPSKPGIKPAKYKLDYKVRFLGDFSGIDYEYVNSLRITAPCSDVDVAKELQKRWLEGIRDYRIRDRQGATIIFDLPDSVVAVHAFKGPLVPRGAIVPRKPRTLELIKGLRVWLP